MATHIAISSSLPAMAIDATTSYITFLEEASSLLEHENGRRAILQIDSAYADSANICVWIFRIPDAASETLESAAARCGDFCQSSSCHKPASLVAPFYRWPARQRASTQQFQNFLLVAIRFLSSSSNIEHDGVRYSPPRKWQRGIDNLWRFFCRDTHIKTSKYRHEFFSSEKAVTASSRLHVRTWPVMGALIMAVFILVIVLRGNHWLAGGMPESSDDQVATIATEWHRYLTGTSVGPKNQLRIQWHNATEWGRLNPHQNGEWAIRMDDQALIPAQYMDNDERDRQKFFWARYPHMAAVIDARDYIRPAWLGSKSVIVEWDHTFHDAHCVMALRRYFKAKETGQHVCPRDIDPGHILHCLNMLENSIFTSGPMVHESPPQYMYWETKVCF